MCVIVIYEKNMNYFLSDAKQIAGTMTGQLIKFLHWETKMFHMDNEQQIINALILHRGKIK